MGAWGEDLLANDDALDFLGNIADSPKPIRYILGCLPQFGGDASKQLLVDSHEASGITVAALYIIGFQKGIEALEPFKFHDMHLSKIQGVYRLTRTNGT